MQYSTTVPNDLDMHKDFKPTNKLESSGLSLKDIVERDVKDNPVMLYMKGVLDLPRCGFSSLSVRVLKEYNVPLSARNILEDPELKNAVKAYSNWPTFPQIFIKGEFIGGSDIILNMHQVCHGNGAFCQYCHHRDHDVSHHDRDVLHGDNHHGHHVRDNRDYVDEYDVPSHDRGVGK